MMVKKKIELNYTIKIKNSDGSFHLLNTTEGKNELKELINHSQIIAQKIQNTPFHGLGGMKGIANRLSELLLMNDQVIKHSEKIFEFAFIGEPTINETYKLNIDSRKALNDIFGNWQFENFLLIDDAKVIEELHIYAQSMRDKWLHPITKKHSDKKISMKEAALICVYKEIPINRSNSNEYATQYGHSSGDSLRNQYTHYKSRQNRIGLEDSATKNKNKLNLLVKVSNYLEPNSPEKLRVLDEIVLLKSKIEEK